MTKVSLGGKSALDYLNFDKQDMDDIAALADDRGGYWQTVHEFVESLRDLSEQELTFKQTSWALNIHDKLDNLRRQGKI